MASLARTYELFNLMQATPVYDSLIVLEKFLSSPYFPFESEREDKRKFRGEQKLFYGFIVVTEVSRDGASVFADTELFMKGLLLQNITSIQILFWWRR